MVTTLPEFKGSIPVSAGMKQQTGGNQGINSTAGGAELPDQAGQASGGTAGDAVSLELSASHDVFSAVDNFFNMGGSGRFDAFHALSADDKEQFVRIVAELAKSGYMGYEELVVGKKVERHEILMQIGDRRLEHARVYDRNRPSRR